MPSLVAEIGYNRRPSTKIGMLKAAEISKSISSISDENRV